MRTGCAWLQVAFQGLTTFLDPTTWSAWQVCIVAYQLQGKFSSFPSSSGNPLCRSCLSGQYQRGLVGYQSEGHNDIVSQEEGWQIQKIREQFETCILPIQLLILKTFHYASVYQPLNSLLLCSFYTLLHSINLWVWPEVLVRQCLTSFDTIGYRFFGMCMVE